MSAAQATALNILLVPVKIRGLLIPSGGQRAIRLCPLRHAPPEPPWCTLAGREPRRNRCDLGKWSVIRQALEFPDRTQPRAGCLPAHETLLWLVNSTVQSLALGCLEDSKESLASGAKCVRRSKPRPGETMPGRFRQGTGGSSYSWILILPVKFTHGQRHSTLTIRRTHRPGSREMRATPDLSACLPSEGRCKVPLSGRTSSTA